MDQEWTHIGRLWTNGEPFLAVDNASRPAWRGESNDDFERIVELGQDQTGIDVGGTRAALVGGDGVVRDDSWIEVFRSATGTLALVQAAGPDYRRALTAALVYPGADDEPGDILTVGSGELAIFSSALDGDDYILVAERPGPVPAVHGPPLRTADPGLLIRAAATTAYRVKIRWYTEVADGACFARWLLTPSPGLYTAP